MISSQKADTDPVGVTMFQSRNRGSFDFKASRFDGGVGDFDVGFNLVIEVLLISRIREFTNFTPGELFQSRNRGSFDFKERESEPVYHFKTHVSIS